tara:strand:- start:7976 stop:9724 length:1749 start_codon:yes stop_codon:yes gene_type:complete
MKKRTYGKVKYIKEKDSWLFEELEPHVSIRLKAIFPKVRLSNFPPFEIPNTPDTANDLEWFFIRYPVKMSSQTKERLETKSKEYTDIQIQTEKILLPSYKPKKIKGLKEGQSFRNHQLVAADLLEKVKRYLLVDALGSGKTYSAIACALKKGSLPAAFVVQAHLPQQFAEKIKEMTNLKVHIIKRKQPYNLPKADIYIFKYTILSGWVDIFAQKFFKLAVFDEIQELRHGTDSNKGIAAKALTDNVDKVLGTTATPIYGYGYEFFNVLDTIKAGCLGSRENFLREWCVDDNKKIRDTKAFGTYLRENSLMLKRSREDIYGVKEAPQIIPEKVDYDENTVKSAEDLAKQLAIKTLTGSFNESGQAARQLDIQLRKVTGVSKAKNVAHFIKMLVDSGEQVLLTGWHRDVYEIWQKELNYYGVSMYTGSETASQKQKNKEDFINGRNKIMIISHKSGAGLDGLQHVCSTVVIGELAWSEEIHKQIIGRVDRDGQTKQVYAFMLMSDYGSDPVIRDILGIKYQQQEGILNPEKEYEEVEIDEKRLKQLAQNYLSKNLNLKKEDYKKEEEKIEKEKKIELKDEDFNL